MLRNVVRPLLGLVIAALLALSSLVLAVAAPAVACSCKINNVEQGTTRADAVFVARIDSVAKTEDTFEYAVTATHAYKGTVEHETTVIANQPKSDCSLGELVTGTDYVFLVVGAAAPYTVISTTCGATGTASDNRVADVEAVLGAGTAIEEPAPPAPTMTKVEQSAPTPAGRLAAPGAAMVLVGLLGLFVVRRLARR